MHFDLTEPRAKQFLSQSQIFVQKGLECLRIESLQELAASARLAEPLQPIIIDSFELSEEERSLFRNAYESERGVAYFICDVNAPHSLSKREHPLIELTKSLRSEINFLFPLEHPLELHPGTIKKFGPPDGTLKVFDVGKEAKTGYREVGESSDFFAMHHDGLGSAGAVQTVAIYLDSAPLFGGFTFFQNIVKLALMLASKDHDAFESLFIPDAATFLRPRGKGAIMVTSPVLFINEQGRPQSLFREPSGEYQVAFRGDVSALLRAKAFLSEFSKPFSVGSTFVHLGEGHGCVINNEVVAHGRTPFINGSTSRSQRLLSRKWYMATADHKDYKHVPGIAIHEDYRKLYPELFAPEFLQGEWTYDASSQSNIKNK